MDFEFNKSLKNFMKERGLKQKDLAKLLENTQSTISLWLSGRFVPGYNDIKKLFELGMNDGELFGHFNYSPDHQEALDRLQRATEKIKALENEKERLNKIIDRLLEAARA